MINFGGKPWCSADRLFRLVTFVLMRMRLRFISKMLQSSPMLTALEKFGSTSVRSLKRHGDGPSEKKC